MSIRLISNKSPEYLSILRGGIGDLPPLQDFEPIPDNCSYFTLGGGFSFTEHLVIGYYKKIQGEPVRKEDLTEDEMLTIFPYIGVYCLGASKIWGMGYVRNITEINYKTSAFDYLVLDNTKKDIIKGLLQNHEDMALDDFVDNKGKGLIFLLYGSPGVGKTLTAEASCENLKRPLYTIGVGDLGANPEDMEKVLKRILEYAERWKAIVLIDEVDIFVESRENAGIHQNCMVSIFLKYLEYNKEIMFLTTNRLHSMDVAVRSRINLLLAYDDLDQKKRFEVLKNICSKWNITVSDDTLHEIAIKEINGRELRNYMKLVLSLHKVRNMELTDKSILKTFKECC